MSKKDKNEYMKNYRKDKKTRSLTLNSKLRRKEDFVKKYMPKVKYIDIYELGLDTYRKHIKNASNELDFKLKELENQKIEKKKELSDIDEEIEFIKTKMENNAQYDLFKDSLNQQIKSFRKKHDIKKNEFINIKNFYDEYKEGVKSAYSNSGLKPSIKNADEEKQKDILLSALNVIDI